MKRRDQADACDPIKTGKRQLRKSLVEIADRHPIHFTMTAVHFADQGGQLGFKLAIGFNIVARAANSSTSMPIGKVASCVNPHSEATVPSTTLKPSSLCR